MKVKIVLLVSMIALLFGCKTPQSAYTQDEMNNMMWYLNYSCEETGITLKSRVFVPATTGKYPIILFLHGAGQKGTDNVTQLYEKDVGKLAYYSDNNGKRVIAVPQCPPDKEWTDADMLQTLDLYVEFVAAKIYVADISDVSVTGFSMGGIGTYKIALSNPERYKTMMPICGGPRAWWPKERDDVPDEMKTTRIWAFNNSNDAVVDNLYSKYFIGQIWQMENEDAHYTEGTNGHADEYVFENKDALNWLLAPKKK